MKSAPATSAVLTSAMVCVSESDIALKRVPAPSAVRFGAGSKQSISGTRRKSAGFLVESSSVSREPLGDVPESGVDVAMAAVARYAMGLYPRPMRLRHRVSTTKRAASRPIGETAMDDDEPDVVIPRGVASTSTDGRRNDEARVRAGSAILGAEDRRNDEARLRAVSAILGADGSALSRLLSSPEGNAVAAMELHDLSGRMLRFRSALPVPDLDVQAMVIEQPSLIVHFSSAAELEAEVKRAWESLQKALDPSRDLGILAKDCPCGFAVALWRCVEMNGTVDLQLFNKHLRDWLKGEGPWHHIFSARIGSEWGYLQTMDQHLKAGDGPEIGTRPAFNAAVPRQVVGLRPRPTYL